MAKTMGREAKYGSEATHSARDAQGKGGGGWLEWPQWVSQRCLHAAGEDRRNRHGRGVEA